MTHVNVLMSTYNGQDYLSEQIDSILCQRDVSVSITIRDDGSTDNTIKILRDYENRFDNISLTIGHNIGVKRSFLKLISNSNSQNGYYALADQDDIWFPDKLYRAITELDRFSNMAIPALYGSSVLLYTREHIGSIQYRPSIENPTFGNFLVKNYFPGCTVVFNELLKQLISAVDTNILGEKPLHDHWLNLVCTGCGGIVIHDNVPSMYYRQHIDNVIGDRKLFSKIKDSELFRSENTRSLIAMEILNKYEDYLTIENRLLASRVANCNESLKSRIRLAFNPEFKPLSKLESIVVVLTCLLGKI